MHIERVQIDDGFLSGVDILLSPGLNVVIGARGTGKTSLIELIRFALWAPAFTEDAEQNGHQQALSVLGDGSVMLTLRDGDERLIVSRSAKDESPRADMAIPPVTVLAQTEIEAVAAHSGGRLHLIDRFRSDRDAIDIDESLILSELRSTTAELTGIRNELKVVDEQIAELHGAREERQQAADEQQSLLSSMAATTSDREKLADLQSRVASLGARDAALRRTEHNLRAHYDAITSLIEAPPRLEDWQHPSPPTTDLNDISALVSQATADLTSAAQTINRAQSAVATLLEATTQERSHADDEARESRRALEALQAGAGTLARKVEELTEKEARLDSLETLANDLRRRLATLQAKRRTRFHDLESLRAKRFDSRRAVADALNAQLMPQIHADVKPGASSHAYVNTIIASLRGSGLHYNNLAPIIAAEMAPLELAEAIENGDSQAIREATDIPLSRAANVVSHMQSHSLADLVIAPVDDAIQLSLLDGGDYKGSDTLSIGQRCTVVLPILLSGHSEPLIIDQPEDHLDNAFIATVLASRLRARSTGDQFILASHNANIPVLGEADRILRLDSDGRRGYVIHEGELDEPGTVHAITSVMEGGVEAFERRAAFYQGVAGRENGQE